MFFSLVQRSFLKELTQTFLLCAVSLLTLILISRGVQMRELFMNLDVSVWDVMLLFGYMMPVFLLLVLPIACMLSIFLTFLRMSTDRELIALKTGGISILQLVQAPILFSLLCMVLSFFVALHGISWSTTQFRTLLFNLANTKAQIVVQPGIFNNELLGKTLFAKNVNPETGEMHQVIFEDKSEDGKTSVIFLAPTGSLATDEEKGQMHFTLNKGYMYQLSGAKINMMSFDSYSVQLDLAKLLAGADIAGIRPKEMGWQELLLLEQQKTPGEERTRFEYKVIIEIHKRMALPFSCFVLGLFAIPVACFFEGVHRQIGMVVALVMFLIYYSIFSMGISLGESGSMSAFAAMWMGNIIFFVLALAGLYFVSKERSFSVISLFQRKQKKPVLDEGTP